jgi:hypothetical protein
MSAEWIVVLLQGLAVVIAVASLLLSFAHRRRRGTVDVEVRYRWNNDS